MPETETDDARDQQQLPGRWSSRRQWRPDDSGDGADRWRPQLDPGTGRPFTEVLDLTAAQATARLEQIRASYHPDRLPPVRERAELLLAMAALVEEHAGDLGELDALCTGKLRAHATGTAQAGAAILRYYAGLLDADTYSAELPADQPGARQFVDRLPVGLAACILPWNFPLSQGCARLAMLFAAGCAGVFKGSELAQPPLLALAELTREAGLPPWAFSVVTGGPDIGQVLTESPLVDAICFTGGISTGIAVAQAAARSLKRVILELGGKTPFVVFADADLDSALDVALGAGFGFQGQACTAGSSLLVDEAVYPDFAARFSARAADLRIGYQLSANTEIGPMISAGQRNRVGSLVDAALAGGARLRAGGSAASGDSDGFFYQPTVLSDIPAGTPMATEEVFGPVVSLRSFATEDEVISSVNDSPYGLAATVWTTSEQRVDRMRATLRTGQLYVNTHGQVPRNTPWGGFRLSGVGRLYGRDGLFAFTEARQTYELGFS
jgi:acyl-CoA reductase-like NAD-dependent aldehyde dehydrogenase